MDNSTTYPSSDTDNNETFDHCEFKSTASNGIDFVDRWVNLTVEKEVLRGSQLREEKLKSYPQLLECETVNIDFIKSPFLEGTSFSGYRSSTRRKAASKTASSSPRSNSPFLKQNQGIWCTQQAVYSRCNTPSLKAKCIQRCPMRIAELAVPTKRQCIDTWRNKSDVLPACMVERLRQQVMDETPIVKISDAINCFQRRRPKSLRSFSKRSKKMNRESKQKHERDAEIRKLCAAFADKIARKLIKPQNLNLSPELEKLSEVVANEITKIIQNRKNYVVNNNAHKIIHADISDKIAVWISTILEESSYKLLEEDLRVKQKSEREIKEDRVVTLIGKADPCKASELEEEEGPILDFIDDLVDNVVTLCEPESINEEKDASETTSKASKDQYKNSVESSNYIKNNGFDTSTLYTNVTYDTEDGTMTKDTDYDTLESKTHIAQDIPSNINEELVLEFNKIIDSIITDNYEEFAGNETKTADNEDGVEHVLSENDNIQQEADKTEEFARELRQLSPRDSESQNQVNSVDSLTDLSLSQPLASETIAITEDNKTNQIVESEESAEDSLDEQNKKVKFSEIDMALQGVPGKLEINSMKENNNGHNENIPWKNSTDSFKNNLILAPLNENLLSDADESWPEDITPLVPKPSASVIRSVTSLGRIMEKDEKLSMLEDQISPASQKVELKRFDQGLEQISLHEEASEIVKKDSNIKAHGKLELHKMDLMNENNDVQEVKSSPILKSEDRKSLIKDNIVQDNDLSYKSEATIVKTENSQLEIPDLKHVNKQLDANKHYIVNEELTSAKNESNFIFEAVQQKIKSSYTLPEPKFDYKVHPNTALSWYHRQDIGKGEPSEDSLKDASKTKAKYRNSEIRSWCKDLDRIFVNLEMWNRWVDTTCNKVLHLKQKREINKLFAPNSKRKVEKKWILLKKNIDKDTILWTKLNQRAYERLKYHKEKAKLVDEAEMNIKSKRPHGEDILKTLKDFDSICLWIHRMIVSTEYCMACDCKNNRIRKM